ncbi:capsular polysaccharide biosynthesis protein [Sulfuritortus calidifontis]|uniref:Capsular polysaccharide biosynthesis protein n=1 Tax=Sulfuritortus calidifontis TaxID=1914471 RepID=A0A4R3JWI0_9PROT|nr:capsule biosynthesis protein [Sulfuritortus calidifontis]TCS72485.1 capsular polysaccharide biosynthesis protein [Sulfuritortus calidifontis]
MTDKKNIVFVSLAQNQSRFFEMVGKVMEKAGYGIVHVSFHEGAVKELRAHGCEAFNPFEYQPTSRDETRFEDFEVANPALLLGHEKAAYEIIDTEALANKMKGHLAAMTTILRSLIDCGGRWCLVQELGGFTPVLAAYYAARRLGMDNWFIEPSFFQGRVFFTANTFLAPRVVPTNAPPSEEVRITLERVVQSRSVVIPVKDRLHYRGAGKKLLDPKNFRRLLNKVVAKYLRGEQEEFQHIGGHVARHVRMFFNSKKLSQHYREIPSGQPFIYYPLHVPADFALTVRSPEYLDQYALIDYLCRVAPLGYRVAIKEHPALIGAVSQHRICDLLDRHDNFILLSPSINNHDVLAASTAVVTVNSKSGAEALLHCKPVIVLGNAFYETCPLVHRVEALSGLQAALTKAMEQQSELSLDDALPFFEAVWNASYPGELYDRSNENVTAFARSLSDCLMVHNA